MGTGALRNRHRLAVAAAVLFAAIPAVSASPATFVTALPVARDQLLIRFNFQPVFSTHEYTGATFPVNIGYGLTSRWGLFANLNQGFGSLVQTTASGRKELSSAGANDTLAYARYTLFKIDKPNSTFRIAPLAGAYFPTGANNLHAGDRLLPRTLQTGSGSVSPYAGITAGFTNIRYGAAADATFRHNPQTATGISPGDQFRADAQFEIKLYPLHMPEEGLPHLVVLSFESNYVHDGLDRVNGLLSANSGGSALKQDVVVEFSSLRWQVGAGGQLPVMQDLNGTGRIRLRSAVYVFFECYLTAPNWRRSRSI